MKHPLTLILGGGKGTRLYPLTQKRAKPDVPLAGRYRLVDIPISNCFHAGFGEIYILTQFNSSTLHSHITSTYRFTPFEHHFVKILAAEQTYEHVEWYKGTADAVRKCLPGLIEIHNPKHFLVLSGDQLYRMDLLDFYRKHVKNKADVSIAVTPIPRDEASDVGILQIDKNGWVTEFMEKPGSIRDITSFAYDTSAHLDEKDIQPEKQYLASMGIYLFKSKALIKALDNECTDFGREIIPGSLDDLKVHAYIFNGYWQDIGTIKSFYDANISLSEIQPPFNFYDESKPILTRLTYLPSSKVNYCKIYQSLISEGCIITNADIRNSIVGLRMIVESNSFLDGVITMGNSYYENAAGIKRNQQRGIPPLGVGKNTSIKRTIIDNNARIGDNCRIGIDDIERQDGHYKHYSIIDGIIVVKQNGVIHHNTVI